MSDGQSRLGTSGVGEMQEVLQSARGWGVLGLAEGEQGGVTGQQMGQQLLSQVVHRTWVIVGFSHPVDVVVTGVFQEETLVDGLVVGGQVLVDRGG